jgi:uracil-DNA glycosylase
MDLYTYTKQNIPEGWEELFSIADPEIKQISNLLEKEKSKGFRIVPDLENIFRVFYMSKPENIKVVILGQDPYFQMLPNGKPRALGFSFSVSKDDAIPSSLQNIYKEIKNCYPSSIIPNNGDISNWVSQGVFLLNACLTCRVGEPGSHNKYKLWMPFFDRFLKFLSTVNKNVIFVLWGKEAQQYESMIEKSFRNILKAVHPSGLSAMRGFFGCNHFKMINDILEKEGLKPIKWMEQEKSLTELYIEYFSKEINSEELSPLIEYYKPFHQEYLDKYIKEEKILSLEEYTIYMTTIASYNKTSAEAKAETETYEAFLKKLRENFESNGKNFYQLIYS